ncbi:hypothetical protein IWQ60_008958 [Tieghemiomyces parasiticus]|uniref:Uncharacterized protein n=1 Tax=Tieghemiomyces parasiticus TaxID=78921 RepID=A0A9W7ZWJ6_9FUNG|nr:hypothetical protein IWQ60_008958 [Tieghemiomyces parasiticus]
MAQGTTKIKAANAAAKEARTNTIKKGVRQLAPKNKTLVQQRQLKKKMHANVSRNLEKMMATRASAVGKLTILSSAVQKDKKDKKGKK